jgi:transcriptional regulator NrdR family protein
MKCPMCSSDSRVIAQRANDGRRRECIKCRWRFTTIELPSEEAKQLRKVKEAVMGVMEAKA